MPKLAAVILTTLAFMNASAAGQSTDEQNLDLQRQELNNLEHEAAHAVESHSGTFFRRIYSDDFVGTLSSGQVMNKAQYLAFVQGSLLKYNFVIASDIAVRLYRDTAVVTCQWASSGTFMGKVVGARTRVTHVYVNGQRGWQVVASQETLLPIGVSAH